MKASVKVTTKEIRPGEAKIKAAIRVMVGVAMRILDKQKQSG